MKKRSILILIALIVLGVGAGTLAYQQVQPTAASTMSCCKGSDKCPMKAEGKGHEGHEKASCCENCECCAGHKDSKDGAKSCPMKDKAAPKTEAAQTSEVTVVEGESCSCPCCAEKKSA